LYTREHYLKIPLWESVLYICGNLRGQISSAFGWFLKKISSEIFFLMGFGR